MPRFLLRILALSLIFPACAYAASQEKVESFKLANGLEVIVIPNHRIPAVSHMMWYRIGAADDPPGKSGLAHFHEHLMFQGTAKYKSGDYAEIISRKGGEQNAFTGADATSYYVNIAKENLPLVMELEADRMRGLKPEDKDVAKEKQVIIEERRQRVENNPDALLNEQVNAALFRNHPYHQPIIGWMSEMENLGKADVLKFHQSYYHPNNAILVVSGDITAAELKPMAEKYYGVLQAADIPLRRWNAEPAQNAARRIIMHHANVRQPEWSRTYSASSLAYGKKEEALPLFVLAQLFGGGKTSRLYQALVVEQKIASAVDTSYSGFNLGPAQFEITVTPEAAVSPEQIETAVDKEIEKIKIGASDAEIVRAKSLLKAESIYARDGLTGMARIMGWLRIAGLDTDYFYLWPELIERVSTEEISGAAKNTLQMNQSVTAFLLPEEKEKK